MSTIGGRVPLNTGCLGLAGKSPQILSAGLGKLFRSGGGAEGIRTPDPHNAIVVLYQLSYDPNRPKAAGWLGADPPGVKGEITSGKMFRHLHR